MPVNSEHPDYTNTKDNWSLVRDIVNNDAKDHIRTVDENDPIRSNQYKDDAILTNFTRLTKDGLVGMVFRKPGQSLIPSELEYMEDDANGNGLSLKQLAKKCINEVQITGRYGLLIDHPREGSQVQFSSELYEQKPRIKGYNAESIINWATVDLGSKTILSMVVLKEDTRVLEGFEWVNQTEYRVLQLVDFPDRDGLPKLVYQQQLYDHELSPKGPAVTPTDFNGETFEHIPFYFIGSENNDWLMDPIPLYDLAVINLGHYRNSADYEESIWMCGQPTGIMGSEMSADEFQRLYGDKIRLGSRSFFYLEGNPYGQYMQPEPNQLVGVAMKEKLDQAVAIGARLITPAGGRETAEGARIRYGSQNSILHTIVDNISIVFVKALRDCLRFASNNQNQEIKFSLNRRFYEDKTDPQMIIQTLIAAEREVFSKNDIRNYARETGFIDEDRTNEEIDEDIKKDPIKPEQQTNTNKLTGNRLNNDDG